MSPRERALDLGRLARWCVEHLGSPPADEMFRSGYLSTVIGLRLADGREVVVKVRPDSPRIAACVDVQRHLFQAGYPCPEPLTGAESEAVIGHCDWLAGNLRWSADELLVVHDWDSVTADSEAALVGFAAALYSAASPDELATVEDTERFLVAYCDARGREFSTDELERSWAAGVWTRAYDAKYQHAVRQPITSLSENEARERLRRAGPRAM
jgi:hypothetical protein